MLADLENELRNDYLESLVGMELQVLIEGQDQDGNFAGTSCRYATVELASSADLQTGQLLKAKVMARKQASLVGQAVPVEDSARAV